MGFREEDLRILKVLPDPSIKHDFGEKIVLINLGPANLGLTSWVLDLGTTKNWTDISLTRELFRLL